MVKLLNAVVCCGPRHVVEKRYAGTLTSFMVAGVDEIAWLFLNEPYCGRRCV